METYDSAPETKAHISRVNQLLSFAAMNLLKRGQEHDQSKLGPLEKPWFDKFTPKLRSLTYGSDEYKQALQKLKPALENHYKANSHHPEHYSYLVCNGCFKEFREGNVWYERSALNPRPYLPLNGRCDACGYGQFQTETDVAKMDLFDLIEMLMDWLAAVERHQDGSIIESLKHNRERFKIGDQLYEILYNHVERYHNPLRQ